MNTEQETMIFNIEDMGPIQFINKGLDKNNCRWFELQPHDVINPEKFKEQMLAISDGDNGIDGNHRDADALMCNTLTQLGFGDGVEVFRSMEKWYE